jgi:hypothetical protein
MSNEHQPEEQKAGARMIDSVFNWLQETGHTLAVAASAPAVPKTVIANLIEKLLIVAIGAGVALWASDQRQAEALTRIETKVDMLERDGSRPVVEVKARVEALDSRLKLIEIHLENNRKKP